MAAIRPFHDFAGSEEMGQDSWQAGQETEYLYCYATAWHLTLERQQADSESNAFTSVNRAGRRVMADKSDFVSISSTGLFEKKEEICLRESIGELHS